MVKSPPANTGDIRGSSSVPGLGRSPGEDMGTHSSIPAWRIPWTEEPGGPQSMASESDTTEWLTLNSAPPPGVSKSAPCSSPRLKGVVSQEMIYEFKKRDSNK